MTHTFGPPPDEAIDRIVEAFLRRGPRPDENPVDILRQAIIDAGYEVDEESFAIWRKHMERENLSACSSTGESSSD